MPHRHPILSIAGFAYFAIVSLMSIAQPAGNRVSFIVLVALFVPVGAMLIAGLGSQRWLLAFVAGVLCVLWLELACIVWNPSYVGESGNVAARILGIVLGIALFLAVITAIHRRSRHESWAFTRLSQARHPQLRPERRHD